MKRIQFTSGCLNSCKFCYEPKEIVTYDPIIDDKDKALRAIGYFIPEDAVENSILKFSDRVLNKNIPVSKTYDVGLRAVTGGSKEYLSPESKITTEGLQEGRTGTESLFKC